MNILHVMGMDSTKYGGIERFNVELTKQAKVLENNIIFIYEKLPDNKQFIDDIINNGGKLYVVNSKKILSFCFQLIKIIFTEKIDVVHSHFTKALFYSIPIAKMCGVKKLFFTIHSTMCPLSEIKPHTKLWYKKAIKISKVISVSQQIETVCKQNWNKINIKTLYLGVEQITGEKTNAKEKIECEDKSTLILTIANFNKVKGLDILCYAVEKIKDQLTKNNCKVLIVGQPEADLEELKQLIKQLNIEDLIIQKGISNNIPDYIIASDIYVQASRHEGLPLALMEVCSAGLPIVASDVGGIPEVVENNKNGFLIKSEDPDILAEKILILINNKDNLREKMGEQNKYIFPKFKVKSNVSKLLKYYNYNL